MKISAHRGASSLAPENTMAAFKKAIELGCGSIELDIQLSKDLIPVVFHDKTVNRCTNGVGKISNLLLRDLRELDAGLWFGDSFKGEIIPTLYDVLMLIDRTGTHLNIELKVYPDDDIEQLCIQTANVINSLDIRHDQLLFSSFSSEALLFMSKFIPTIRRGQLWQKVPKSASRILQEIQAYSVHCDYRFLNEYTAQMIKFQGYQLYCYTPNFPILVENHHRWGVDMVITDVPQDYLGSPIDHNRAVQGPILKQTSDSVYRQKPTIL